MKKLLSFFIVISLIISSQVFAYTKDQLESANNLAKKEIIKNHEKDPFNYHLNAPVLRQEIALISRRVSGVAENTTCKNIFADVSATRPNTWVCKNVEALVEHKLISKNKVFNPERNISKSEALIMFIKSIGFPEFEIKNPKNWQKEVVNFAVKNEVVMPFTDYNAEAKRGWIFQIADYSMKVKEERIKKGTWKKKKISGEAKVGDKKGGDDKGKDTGKKDEEKKGNEDKEPKVGTDEFLKKYPKCTKDFRNEIKEARKFNAKIDLKAASQYVAESTIGYTPCSSQTCRDVVKKKYLEDQKCYIGSECYKNFKLALIKCASKSMDCKEKAFCGFVTK